MYSLYRDIEIECDRVAAWTFICRPENLNLITPPDLDFHIESQLPDEMYNGLLIQYRVKIPLIGYRPWVSEIKHIRDGYAFVDEQRIGPYALWYHQHELREGNNGVRFIDSVHYQIPYAILGRLAHMIFVRRNLERIFDFREQALRRYFEHGAQYVTN